MDHVRLPNPPDPSSSTSLPGTSDPTTLPSTSSLTGPSCAPSPININSPYSLGPLPDSETSEPSDADDENVYHPFGFPVTFPNAAPSNDHPFNLEGPPNMYSTSYAFDSTDLPSTACFEDNETSPKAASLPDIDFYAECMPAASHGPMPSNSSVSLHVARMINHSRATSTRFDSSLIPGSNFSVEDSLDTFIPGSRPESPTNGPPSIPGTSSDCPSPRNPSSHYDPCIGRPSPARLNSRTTSGQYDPCIGRPSPAHLAARTASGDYDPCIGRPNQRTIRYDPVYIPEPSTVDRSQCGTSVRYDPSFIPGPSQPARNTYYERVTSPSLPSPSGSASLPSTPDGLNGAISKRRAPIGTPSHATQQYEDQFAREQYARDQYARDQFARNQPGRNQQARNQSVGNPPARNQPARNQSGRNPSGRNPSGRNPSGRNQSSRNQSSRNQSSRNQSSRNQSWRGQSSRRPSSRNSTSPPSVCSVYFEGIMQNLELEELPQCGICNTGKLGVVRCTTCDSVHLCGDCGKSHCSSTRYHNMVPLIRRESLFEIENSINFTHFLRNLLFQLPVNRCEHTISINPVAYCDDCRVILCRSCMRGYHNRCLVIEITNRVLLARVTSEALALDIQITVGNLEERLSESHLVSNSLRISTESCIYDVNRLIDAIRNIIHENLYATNSPLDILNGVKIVAMNYQLENLETYLRGLNEAILMIQNEARDLEHGIVRNRRHVVHHPIQVLNFNVQQAPRADEHDVAIWNEIVRHERTDAVGTPIGRPIFGLPRLLYITPQTRHSMTFASSGSLPGQLCRPWGVTCDKFGNILVADRSNNRIQIFDEHGHFKHQFGRPGFNAGEFDRPAGITIDYKGRIIVADKDNHRIQVFTKHGVFAFMFGEKGSGPGQFNYPWDVATNSEGQIAVTDTRNSRIQLFSDTGVYIDHFMSDFVKNEVLEFESPRGIAFSPKGDILFTDFNEHHVVRIHIATKSFHCVTSSKNNLSRPQGLVTDDRGNIIVADSRNNCIQILDKNGNQIRVVGRMREKIEELDRPCGVAIDAFGRIVIVDFGNNRVQGNYFGLHSLLVLRAEPSTRLKLRFA